MKRIINSLLDTDLYKFSMGQVIYHQFNSYTTRWDFKCRNKDVVFTKEMVDEIKSQIDRYCELRFTEDELNYLASIQWLKQDYIDFLRLWRPRAEEITVNYNDGKLEIFAEGSWLNTSMYEIAILAIVNEVYFTFKYNMEELRIEAVGRFLDKMLKLQANPIGTFSEFGTRRRLSASFQDAIMGSMKNLQVDGFIGTSNVYLAKKYNLKPVGTMAHEFIMCVGQGNFKHNPAYSNWYMMEAWVKEYGILNGIALTDTIGTDNFLKDFQLTYATLFSGVRHDSGNPIAWGNKMIMHYQKLGIDPKTKTLLFSDSLDFEKARRIKEYFEDKINVAFGIGTYLTNDTNVDSLNIVMKVTECNGSPVAKLSDSTGKNMCRDEEYIEYLKNQIKFREKREG